MLHAGHRFTPEDVRVIEDCARTFGHANLQVLLRNQDSRDLLLNTLWRFVDAVHVVEPQWKVARQSTTNLFAHPTAARK